MTALSANRDYERKEGKIEVVELPSGQIRIPENEVERISTPRKLTDKRVEE